MRGQDLETPPKNPGRGPFQFNYYNKINAKDPMNKKDKKIVLASFHLITGFRGTIIPGRASNPEAARRKPAGCTCMESFQDSTRLKLSVFVFNSRKTRRCGCQLS